MRRITRLVVLVPELRPLGAALLGGWACACRPALGAGCVVVLVGPVCGLPGWEGCHASACSSTPHKLDKCNCSLQRYDAISNLTQLVSAGFVHQIGHPISQHANAGFNRRGKVRSVGDNGLPSRVERTGCEKWCSTKFGSCSPFEPWPLSCRFWLSGVR